MNARYDLYSGYLRLLIPTELGEKTIKMSRKQGFPKEGPFCGVRLDER